MEKLYTVGKNKNYGSEYELLIAKLRLKLKKVGEKNPPGHSGMT